MPQARANDIDIEYESFGRDGDPTILLIAGFAAQLTLWPEDLCRGLAARGFRVIHFDNRDIGKSTHFSDRPAPDSGQLFAKVLSGQPAEAPYSLDDMAGDAAGLLDALGIVQAHIVGASMGGMIAQLFAAHYPEKTTSLVSIMSTTGRRDLPQAAPEVMAVLATPPKSTGRSDRIEAAIHGWRVIGSPGYPQSDAEIRATAEREVDRTPYDAAGLARQLAAIITAQPRNEILKSVRAPTLVIHGADDPLVPASGGEDTARSVIGSEWISIPGGGHDFPAALTPIYLQHIGNFVSKVEMRRKAGEAT
jgi:pimeloyl-ACP methyl ester carboxylesterase